MLDLPPLIVSQGTGQGNLAGPQRLHDLIYTASASNALKLPLLITFKIHDYEECPINARTTLNAI